MVIDSYVNGKNNQKSLNFQLAQAAGLGDNEAVVKLLGLGADINSTHTDNVTPIYAAASSGHLETVALLIKEGADVNIPLRTGETPLMISAHNCFLEIVQNILATGKANIEAKVGRYTAIYFAIKANCPKVVEQLLAVNAVIDSDKVGYSSLITSQKTSYPLVKRVSELNIFNRAGFDKVVLITMIKNEEDIIFENLVWHFTIGFRKFVIVDNLSTDQTRQKIDEFVKLTEQFAKVFIIEDPIFEHIQSRIVTGAYHLVHSVWPEVTWTFPVDADEFWTPRKPLKEILDNIPSNIDAIKSLSIRYHPTEDYYSFNDSSKFYEKLHYHSIYHKSDNVMIHMPKIAIRPKNYFEIEQGNHGAHITSHSNQNANINYASGDLLGLNLFEFQLRSAEQAHRKYFNGMQANLKAQESGMTSKWCGIHWNAYLERIKKYGEEAGEVQFKESFVDLSNLVDDVFPIQRAIEVFYEIVEQKESNIEKTNNYSEANKIFYNRQLFEAAAGDEDKVIELVNKADVNSKHDLNATALYAAAKYGHIEIVKILLTLKGIDIDATIKNGATALYTAMRNGHLDIFKLLLDAGADTEILVEGYKPLHTSAYLGLVEEVEYLLKKGATVDYGRKFDITTALIELIVENRNKSPKYAKIYDLIMQHYWIEFKNSQPETQIIPIQNTNKANHIPKIIHRIWMVWDTKKLDMPEIYKEFDVVIKNLHPDWQFMEWNDKTIFLFISEFYPEFLSTYLAYDAPVKRHDACRYFIMDHFGGVFIQHSFRFQKNIKPLLEGADLVLSEDTRYSGLLQNGFLASVPHHPFWKILIDALPNKANLSVLNATGPHLLATVVKDYLARSEHEPIRMLNREYLLPFNWNEKHIPIIHSKCIESSSQCFELFPNAYAFNLWSWSWRYSINNTAKVDLSILENKPLEQDYKVLVLNLPKSKERLEKISKNLDSAGISYEVFIAVNGYYDVVLTNILTGQRCIGRDIIDKDIKISLNTPYEVTCNSKIYEQASFKVTLTQRVLNAGEFGRWCSDVMMWQYIKKNNYTTTIVFEDDFAPLEHNFKPLVDNFIKALPSGYHIGYIDTWITEGGITPLPGNRNHIAQFMSNSKWYGTWAVVLSKKFITEILSTTHYYGMQDEMLLERANNNQLDVYVSSIKLASISSFELTGQSKNSEISKMGFRADHPNSGNFDLGYDISKHITEVDKIYVISLENSIERKKAMQKQLNEAGIEYGIFNATDGYKVKIKNLKTNQEFFGSDIKNGSTKIEKSVMYKITCNPDDELPIEFHYLSGLSKGISAGELGVWCSNRMIWSDIDKNKYKKVIIFEDDIRFKVEDPKQAINDFVTHVPQIFDIAYLDLEQYEGKQHPLPNNEYVNGFGDNSAGYGAWSILYSSEAIKKLLSLSCYSYTLDDFLWSITTNINYKRTECVDPSIIIKAYVSSKDLLDVTGNDSLIKDMGRETWSGFD